MDDLFGKVVVVNLDSDTSKWQTVQQELAKSGTTRFERLPATAGNALDGSQIEAVTTRVCAEHCTPAMIGCALSHMRAWRMCVEQGLPSMLILEDDVVFADDVAAKCRAAFRELPPDWSLLALGCFTCDGAPLTPSRPYSAHLQIPSMLAGTHAYAVSRAGAARLLRLVPKVATHIDWSITKVIKKLNAYAIMPGAAFQADMDTSNIAGKAPVMLNAVCSHFKLGSNELDGRTLSWILSENFSKIGPSSLGIFINGWVSLVFKLAFLAGFFPPYPLYLIGAIVADASASVACLPQARDSKVAKGYTTLLLAALAGWSAAIGTAVIARRVLARQ